MIVVSRENGEFVKGFFDLPDGEYGQHSLFGLVSKDEVNRRLLQRKKKLLPYNDSYWLYRFNIKKNNDVSNLNPVFGCETKKVDGRWQLTTPAGIFIISENTADKVDFHDPLEIAPAIGNKRFDKIFIIALFLFVALLGILSYSPEVEEEEKVEPEPITVMIQPLKTVPIRAPIIKAAAKTLTKSQKAHRSVKRNLGFLGLIGKKHLKKAVGGAPTELKKASAGAGSGTQGSGGEFLVGLGKGVRKTTVGNTGVQGLGGIGTKGAGGGKGGYGTVEVASGEGAGLSHVAISQDMVLEGGLSRYEIQATIAKYLNQVRACYESQLKTHPGLTGTVDIAFEVSGVGRLNFARTRGTSLSNPKVESCITRKMMGWKFPKPRGGVSVKVNYPFLLRPVRS